MKVLIATLVITIALNVAMLSSCAWFGNPHQDGIHIHLPDTEEDVRG